MLNSIVNGTAIPLLEKVAVFGERRQAALAANVANIDTPNYKRRDLPVDAFQKALRDVIAHRQSERDKIGSAGNPREQGAPVANGSSQPFPRQLFQAVEASSPSLTFQDNNNRSVEHEVMEMTKNTLTQSFAIELMNAQMGMLQAVIRQQA